MRKALIAGAQVAVGSTLTALLLLGEITEVPYSVFAIMVGTTLMVDGCRNLHALRADSRDSPRDR
ncbi:hypothetical protein ABZX85_24875 [Streptomyces sp. NPDC004539]|uniref:hypothetical protein n=1 Tax=Streptomyces sp. NPDC004539 TaxID=3154280 RepID=UPI0033BE0111